MTSERKKTFPSLNRLFIFYVFCIFIILGSFLIISSADAKVKFNVDYAYFKKDSQSQYLEIYYLIERQSLARKGGIEGLWSAFQIKTFVYEQEQPVAIDSFIVEDLVNSQREIQSGHKLEEASLFIIKPGTYSIKVNVTDMVDNHAVSWKDTLKTNLFSDKELALSSIEIASVISPQVEKEHIFDKNGLRVIPRADRIFSRSLPKIYYYLEAYNFSWEAAAQASGYTVNYEILNMNGTRIMNLKGKPKKKPGATAVIHGALDVQELASGAYSLVISVVDLDNNQSARTEKSFMIFNKEDLISKSTMVTNKTTLVDSEKYNQMDEALLNEYFNQLRYITTESEKKIFKKLNLVGKRNLIFDFWAKGDPNPGTPINEREVEYNDMLEYVNETFIQDFRKGWKCDRARVLLLYGLPNTKETVPVSNENKPYEIWHYYDLEEGVIFIFVDKWMNGSYDLVHSTKRNEIHEEEWFDVYAQRK